MTVGNLTEKHVDICCFCLETRSLWEDKALGKWDGKYDKSENSFVCCDECRANLLDTNFNDYLVNTEHRRLEFDKELKDIILTFISSPTADLSGYSTNNLIAGCYGLYGFYKPFNKVITKSK